MTSFQYDLAVSALPYDAALVSELFAELAPRLGTIPVWDSDATRTGPEFHASLVAEHSRVALVLHQRLWQHDGRTSGDAVLLRARMRARPDSVCVMTLDDTPVPTWLSEAPHCDLATVGVRGAANFALEAITSCGGTVRALPRASDDVAPTRPGWAEGAATPFLGQLRAQSALRHQLDALAAGLTAALDARRLNRPDVPFEMHVLPHRFIARLEEVGISFSWVSGRTPSVADGRLLVIQWTGVATETRGIAALKSATPVRERVYRAEATGAEHWCWRVDGENGQAYSTANLVAEWLASSAMQPSA